MNRNKDWIGALTGVAFVVVAIIAIVLQGGEPPDADDAAELVEFYDDNEGGVMFGSGFQALAATLLVFFGGYLRKVLRAAEGEGRFLSTVAFAGAVILAVGIAIDATINFALADTFDDIEPAAVQALAALWQNDFFPLAVGLQVLFLAAGISIVLYRALPVWLGWVAILLGVLAGTPIGFFAFPVGALWIAVVSVMLALRGRSGTSARAPAV